MKKLIIAIIFLLIYTFLFSQQAQMISIEKNINLLIQQTYAQNQEDTLTIASAQLLKKKVEQQKDLLSKDQYHYFNAEIEFQIGKVYQLFNTAAIMIEHNRKMRKGSYSGLKKYYDEIERVQKHYHLCLDEINLALAIAKKSDYYRLKSAVIGDLCLVDSLGFLLINGPTVSTLAKQSLQLNSNNIKAAILIIASKVFPPIIYGGNPEMAIKMLNELKTRELISQPEDFFDLYSALAYSNGRLDNYEEAMKYIKQALEIYPQNNFAKGLKVIIENQEF